MKRILFFLMGIAVFYGCKEEIIVTELIDPVPTVKILSLQNNSSVVENSLIKIEAKDDIAISKVELYINDKTNANQTFTKEPFEFLWNTGNLSDGSSYTLYAKAYDGEGNSSESEKIKVIVRKMLPTNLLAKFESDTAAILTWKDNCKFESGFEIEQSTDSVNYSLVKLEKSNSTQTEVAGAYTKDQKYFFRIRAVTDTLKSGYSDVVFSKFSVNTPTDVKIENTDNPTVVKLSWRSANSFKTQFEIEQKVDNSDFQSIKITALDETSDLIENIDISKNNYFRVRAVTKNNTSDFSNTVQHNFISLNAPTNLKVEFSNDTEAKISWKDNEQYEDGYEIEASTDGTNFSFVKSLPKNSESTIISGVYEKNKNYYFRVRAYIGAVKGPFSNTGSSIIAINEPQNLRIENTNNPSSIKLFWQPNSSVQTKFQIEQKINNNSFEVISTVPENYFNINGISNNTIYEFRVKAVTDNNSSDYSNVVKYLIISAPGNLAMKFNSDSEVNLTWSDNTTIEEGFEIEFSQDGNNYSLVKSVPPNTTSTAVNGIYLKDRNYYFRIRALAFSAGGAYSNVASGKFTMKDPYDLKLSETGDPAKINLEWKAESDIPVQYEVEQKINSDSYKKIATASTNTFEVSNIKAGDENQFRVKSVATHNSSGYSNSVNYSFLSTIKFGLVKIYEAPSGFWSFLNGIDLSTGSAYQVSENNPTLQRVDIFYSKEGESLASAKYVPGSNRETYFYETDHENINDGRDAPEFNNGRWKKFIDADDEDEYFFLYDADGNYSKMRIVNEGGNGTYFNPRWIEVEWIYNTIKNDRRF